MAIGHQLIQRQYQQVLNVLELVVLLLPYALETIELSLLFLLQSKKKRSVHLLLFFISQFLFHLKAKRLRLYCQ